jgi:Zn-dependent metalloprotease
MIRLVPIGLVFAASMASAATRTRDAGLGEVSLPAFHPVQIEDQGRQVALTRGQAWQQFTSRFGPWNVMWNEATGTPHRAFGPPIPLRGFSDNPAAVNSSVKSFVAGHPELFGESPTLEPAFIERQENIWYVRYRQMVGGVPVLFTDWEFRVSADGRLVAFGADARNPGADVVTTPRVALAVAREAAKSGLSFDPASDRVEGGQDLYLLPSAAGNGAAYRLVYDFRVFTARPRGNWITLVDAATGEVVWRHNRVRYANISGTVTGRVHVALPTDPTFSRAFRDLYVTVASTQVYTDSLGAYSTLCSGSSNVSAQMKGRFCHVDRADGVANAAFGGSASCPGTKNIVWDSYSEDSERDAYYHATRAHTYVKGLDPAYTASDHDLSLTVESLDDECFSYWDGVTITFGTGGSTCRNMATIPSIVYHEYGHRVDDDLYFWRGSPFGMMNEVLHEATADLNAAFILDDQYIGKGYDAADNGAYLRNLAEVRRWPEDRSTANPQETGRILSGAFWDLRQSLGLSLAEHLKHFAQYGIPDDPDDGVAMSEYFVETLIADDNNGNISDGTPHIAQIVAAFSAHGIGTNYFLNISHTPLDDQVTGGPYPVTAVIQYTGPVGGLDVNSPTLYYSANGSAFLAAPMSPTGNPDEWGAEISGQSASVVHYYIQARELNGGVKTMPSGAPGRFNVFTAGPASTMLSYDMEADPGWTAGAAGDNAATGIWVRAVPIGDGGIAQPDEAHSPTMCWVTGNAGPSDPPGANDVDAGKTTLLTSIFDATAAPFTCPIISYYRWFSNNGGELPGTSYWQVDISNDGGVTWYSVEHTNLTDQLWKRVMFFVQDYVPPSNNMRMRFVASDFTSTGSLVEAGVDDWDLIGFVGPVAVPDPGTAPRPMALAPAAPNPFQSLTRLHYTLPVAGRVDLSVYDIHGRAVRALVAADQEAGPHTIEWDGRDNGGHPAPSGPYFLRLSQGGIQSSRAVVRIR